VENEANRNTLLAFSSKFNSDHFLATIENLTIVVFNHYWLHVHATKNMLILALNGAQK